MISLVMEVLAPFIRNVLFGRRMAPIKSARSYSHSRILLFGLSNVSVDVIKHKSPLGRIFDNALAKK